MGVVVQAVKEGKQSSQQH